MLAAQLPQGAASREVDQHSSTNVSSPSLSLKGLEARICAARHPLGPVNQLTIRPPGPSAALAH